MKILPAAEAVLSRLVRDWAEQGSVVSALQRYAALRERLGLLGEFPEIGRKREELAPGYRTFSFDRRITVAYRVVPNAVYIVDIFVRGQNPFGHDPDDDAD